MIHRFRRSAAGRLCCLVMAVMVFLASSTPVRATSGTATTSSQIGTSMYDVSTALTAFANAALGPNSNDKHGDITTFGVDPLSGDPIVTKDLSRSHTLYEFRSDKVGNGGGYVGYGDARRGFVGYFQTNETQSLTSSDYEAYQHVGDGGIGYAYVRYGRLLNDLGLDDTGEAAGSDPIRGTGGKILQIVYLVSSFIPKLFEISFQILDTLNPFRLLIGSGYAGSHTTTDVATGTVVESASSGASLSDAFEFKDSGKIGGVETDDVHSQVIDGLDNGSDSLVGVRAMAPIIDYITNIYNMLRGIGLWIVMPLMTALLLFTIFVMGQSKAWGAIQKYAVRFVFIVVGIPFLGVTYTAVLDEFKAISANNNRPSTRIVAASLCDFEAWCKTWRLEPPKGSGSSSVTLVSEGGADVPAQGSTSSDSWRTVRNTVYQVNYSTGLYSLKQDSGLGLGSTDGKDYTYAGMFNADVSGGEAGKQAIWITGPAEAGKEADNRNSIESMISTYQMGSFYSASSWAGNVNTLITGKWSEELGVAASTASSAAIEETVYQMYSDTDDMNDWLNRQQDENAQILTGEMSGGAGEGGEAPKVTVRWADNDWNIFCNGGTLGVELHPDDMGRVENTTLTYKGKASTTRPTDSENKPVSGVDPSAKIGGRDGENFGLSSISMYNYLSTAFNSSGVNVYSGENSTSEFTKRQHFAVSMAGSGVTRMAYCISCVVVLGVYVVLGFYYAVGMVISVLKHGFSMIMSIPAAMFGVMKSIVQVCAYVVQMITEILSSVFLYQVVLELVLVFATVAETPIKKALDELSASAVVGGIVGDSTALSLTLRLAECRPLFTVTLFTVIVMTICLATSLLSVGRAVLCAFTAIHYRVAYMITLDEFKPWFAEHLRERGSLDIWSDVAADGRQAVGAAGRIAGRVRDLAGQEIVSV